MKTTTETTRGAYSNTPHKTIEELITLARARVQAGEDAYAVRQDIVNGYSLGFYSANDSLIAAAITDEEEAIALGFRSASDERKHAAWLAQHGSREYKALLVSRGD